MLYDCGALIRVQGYLFFHLLLELKSDPFSVLDAHLNNLQCVPEQTSLDSFINGCIRTEGRCVIDLKHPGL